MTNNTKPSGIEWIGNIPSDWEVKPVKYILESNQKTLSESTKKDYTFRYIDIGSVDFDKGITNYEEMNFENAPSRARRIVKKGDTIISTVRTYLKAIARIEEDKDVIVSTGFAVLSPKNNESGFIEYYCKSDIFCSKIEKLSYGIAYPAINESVLVNIKMILPPPAEQKAIAAFLDAQCGKIDNIITDLEQQIEILKEYKTSLITEAVTKGLDKDAPMKNSGIDWIGKIPSHWDVKRLGFLFTFGKGLGITKEDLQDEGIPCVNYGEIHSKYGFEVDPVKNKLKCVYEKYLKTSPDSLLNYGDFVFADTSEDIEGSGNFTHLNSNGKTFAGYHTIILRAIEKLNYKYIAYLFDSILFRTQIRSKVWGIKVYSITKQILKNTKLLLPPPSEQKTIATFLDGKCKEISDIITEKQQSIDTVKAYKKSLIYEYVTGKKRVKSYL